MFSSTVHITNVLNWNSSMRLFLKSLLYLKCYRIYTVSQKCFLKPEFIHSLFRRFAGRVFSADLQEEWRQEFNTDYLPFILSKFLFEESVISDLHYSSAKVKMWLRQWVVRWLPQVRFLCMYCSYPKRNSYQGDCLSIICLSIILRQPLSFL